MRITTLSLLTLLVACGGDKSDTGTPSEGPAGDTGTDGDDTGDVEDDTEPDACSAEGLRALALGSGSVIMDGVSMEASTLLADITADPESYEGQAIQIEGTVIDLCDSRGCWSLLSDGAGSEVRLKVNDGTVDFRSETTFDEYAIGEGAYEAQGEYGPQIWITGAVVVAKPDECE
jgi:hypothetical protein